MLKNWNSHASYKEALITNLSSYYPSHKYEILALKKDISKLFILDLDELKDIISFRFSNIGRPAQFQPEIFRSFILMLSRGITSITRWINILNHSPLYCILIGFPFDNIPSLGAHYKFLKRLWISDENYDKPKLLPFKTKPKNKLKKNHKKSEKSSGIVKKLVDKIIEGCSFKRRPERLFQKIFNKISVEKSASFGLLGDINKLNISGDGTCIKTGASSYGIKICDCRSKGIFDCKCTRKFSDPNATWGWDSYHGQWFYGYSSFLFTTYSKELRLDLPIYFRVLEAKRHDSVSAVVSLQELKELSTDFKFNTFIGDSAFDNYPTYELLDHWKISPIIALNLRAKANYKYYQPILNNKGIPICEANNEMIYDGPSYTRRRVKWRCPLATNKINHCPNKPNCSPSDYGRTHHTNFDDDIRLFTPIARGTKKWKNLMKTRTGAERINSRILNDYSIENTKARGKKHWSWWILISNINIHLDAQIKHAKFDFLIDPIQLIENHIAA